EDLAGGGKRLGAVWQRQILTRCVDVHPIDLRRVEAPGAVAAAEALHQRRPGSELGEQHPAVDVDARLHRLGGDDDATCSANGLAQALLYRATLPWAEPRMQQQAVWATIARKRAIQRLGAVHAVEDHRSEERS